MGLLEHFQKSFPIPKVCLAFMQDSRKETFGIGKQYRDSPSRRLKSRCDLGEFARIRHLRRAESPCIAPAPRRKPTAPPRRGAAAHQDITVLNTAPAQHGSAAAQPTAAQAYRDDKPHAAFRQAKFTVPRMEPAGQDPLHHAHVHANLTLVHRPRMRAHRPRPRRAAP